MAVLREALTSEPGLYALALWLEAETEITIGALGSHVFPKGHYVYVGSAWGPGGLAARVGRHLRVTHKRARWHIDYARAYAEPTHVWLAPHARGECAWAHRMLAWADAHIVVPRFGASDCTCPTHLAHFTPTLPPDLTFPNAMRLEVEPVCE